MSLLEIPKIIDTKTGEVLQINQFKPKKIEAFLSTQENKSISELLSKVNFVKKIADKIETTTKHWIKSNKDLGLDSEGRGFFEDWKVSKITSLRFNEKKLMVEGNKKDISDWKRLKAKYSTPSEFIKFG